MAPIRKSSSPGTGFSGPRYFDGPHTQMLLSRDSLLRTSLLLWSPYTNLPLPGQGSQDLATSIAPTHKSCSPMTSFSGPRYFYGPNTQIFLSRDRLLRTSLLRWPPYTNVALPGQPSQDLATSMVSIHKSSSPGTGFSGPRYFDSSHTQILLSRDRLLRTSLLLWPPYTNLPLPGQTSQDLGTSMTPHIGTRLRFRDRLLRTPLLLRLLPLAHSFRSWDRLLRTSLLL